MAGERPIDAHVIDSNITWGDEGPCVDEVLVQRLLDDAWENGIPSYSTRESATEVVRQMTEHRGRTLFQRPTDPVIGLREDVQSADMVSDGAPSDGKMSVRTITDSVQNELRVGGVHEALGGIGVVRAARGEAPLGSEVKASLLGSQARGIFDRVTDRVTHRPPAARQKPR